MNASELKPYASESCHAYDVDGNPRYEVPCKSRPGEFRKTTLADIRKNGWLPSVSGILQIMAQPGLKRWRDRQIAEASLIVGVQEDATIEEALELAEERMSVARERGSEIHGAIENYFREYQKFSDCSILESPLQHQRPHCAHIKAAIHALDELGVVGMPFRSERSFASPFWGFGGCTDYVTESGKGDIVVDFKITQGLSKRHDWPDRQAQCSAYLKGIGGSITRAANIYIDSETAQYVIKEWTKEEIQYGWELFLACRNLWCVSNRYFPSQSLSR